MLSKAFIDLLLSIKKNHRIVIFLDEIEYISPLAELDPHWKGDFVPFWQTIWSAQSERRSISVVVAGVNATVCEMDTIDGVQNPLFGIVPHGYLRGLELEPFKRMLKVLGRRMGLRFSDDAIAYLHGRYSGHPLLSRLACSFTHRDVRERDIGRPVSIGQESLVKDELRRDGELASYCGHVVSELAEFYPIEYQLLEMIAVGDKAGFLEISIFPEYNHHLREYGLISDDEAGVSDVLISVVANYVALEKARREGRRTILRVVDASDRTSWLVRRRTEIVEGLRYLERLIRKASLPTLFGPNSFPQGDRFI